MKKINDQVYSYINHINRIEYVSNYIILYSNDSKYFYFDKSIDKKIYDYLASIDFTNCLDLITNNDKFSLFSISIKEDDFPLVLSNLCNKSSKDIIHDDEKTQEKYDELYLKIDSFYKYYLKIQDEIEESLYPSESQYNLIINISMIYKLLDLGKYFLDEWYKSDKSINREVFVPKDLSYKNFLDGNILDFSKSEYIDIDLFLDNYYKSNYIRKDILKEIDKIIYNCSFSSSECNLFFVQISLSKMINTLNIIDVNSLNYYVRETYNYLLKKYKENQESD